MAAASGRHNTGSNRGAYLHGRTPAQVLESDQRVELSPPGGGDDHRAGTFGHDAAAPRHPSGISQTRNPAS